MKQILRSLRRTVLLEVARASDNDEAEGFSEANAHHVAFHELAQANSRVEAARDDIDTPILEHELDFDLWVTLPEHGQHGANHEVERGSGHGQSQAPDRLARLRGGTRERRPQLGEGWAGRLQKALARVGQRNATRRPHDEHHPQLLFQVAHALAYRGARDTEITGRRAETARLSHGQEGLELRKEVGVHVT